MPAQNGSRMATATSTPTARSPAVVVRKRLPWLEKQASRPDTAAMQNHPVTHDDGRVAADAALAQTDGKASVQTLGSDFALRAIGSAPSLRQKDSIPAPSAFSQRSQLPPGSRALPMIGNRPEPAKTSKKAYVSSEYSVDDAGAERFADDTSPVKSRESARIPVRPSVARATSRQLSPKTKVKADGDCEPASSAKIAEPKTTTELQGTKTLKPSPRCKSCDDRAVLCGSHSSRPRPQDHRRSIDSHDDSIYRPRASRPLPTKSPTVYNLPLHLMAHSSDSSSRSEIVQIARQAQSKPETPSVLNDFRFSGPVLSTAHRLEPNAASGPLNRAVTGLENLMGEALTVARDAAKSGRPDEVAGLLNEATQALRQASSVHGRLRQPLSLSPADSMHSSDTDHEDFSSNASSRPSREASAETLSTVFTKSSMQPLAVGPTSKPTLPSKARNAGAGDRRHGHRFDSSPESISHTPPRLYPAASAESVVRDFAYNKAPRKYSARSNICAVYGAAASFYGDHGESVATQPGIRKSIVPADKQPAETRALAYRRGYSAASTRNAMNEDSIDPKQEPTEPEVKKLKAVPSEILLSRRSFPAAKKPVRQRQATARDNYSARQFDNPNFMHDAYYRDTSEHLRQHKPVNSPEPQYPIPEKATSKASGSTGHPPLLISRNLSLKHPRRGHLSIQTEQGFSLGGYHKRQPIARE